MCYMRLVRRAQAVTGAAVGVLAAYRRHCASQSSSAQLILPEALKLLPLYALALLKSPALGCAASTPAPGPLEARDQYMGSGMDCKR